MEDLNLDELAARVDEIEQSLSDAASNRHHDRDRIDGAVSDLDDIRTQVASIGAAVEELQRDMNEISHVLRFISDDPASLASDLVGLGMALEPGP